MVVTSSTDSRQVSDDEPRWPPATARDNAPQGPDGLAPFQRMVEHDADAICIVDAGFRVVYANPAARATLAIAEFQQWRRRATETRRVHPEDMPRLEQAVSTSGSQGGSSTTEVRIEMPDDEWRWFVLTVCDLRSDPAVAGFLIRLHDIDRMKQGELAMQEQLEILRRQNQNKSAFLSTISHEFRTPLTSIIGYSEFLAANASDPALVAEDAEVIHREAARLSRMVDDVLLMDRADNGHLSLNLQLVDVNAMATAVTAALRPLMTRHRLELHLDPALPGVLGDRDRLEQALTNLISNAVKFSDHGGAITVSTARAGTNVVVSVRDEGMGIAQEDLERIFQRFERVETGISGRTVGTGLGLAIVSEITRLHQGYVEVESEIGAGSTFSIVLPVSAP